MWWALGGIGVVLYIVLLLALGVMCIRKGHWVLFVLGFFMPFFWIIGAIMRPANPRTA
jgi:hypothetical protein